MSLARPATTLGSPKVVSTVPLKADDAKFIEINELKYIASNGKERRWECANRKTRTEDVVADAVDIFTRISHPKLPESTIIVLQFRAPVNAISVEFPAGLIDKGESPEQAALRELAEETGYGSESSPETQGEVEYVSRPLADSPGMSTETTVFVCVKIALPDSMTSFPEPKQKLDEGEFIETRIVAIKDLFDTLQAYQDLGYKIDTRLHHIAYGLKYGAATM